MQFLHNPDFPKTKMLAMQGIHVMLTAQVNHGTLYFASIGSTIVYFEQWIYLQCTLCSFQIQNCDKILAYAIYYIAANKYRV